VRRRAALGLSESDRVVGTVGRLDPIKNLPMFVDALAGACRADPRVKGIVVGGGPQHAEIERRIEAAGLTGRVLLTGHRDDARALVGCFDLFVLASFSEGTSLALLEAMSAGVPAAVTAVGGNPELVEAGRSGWVVPSGDTAALEAAIRQAFAEPELRARYAEAAQLRYESRFTMQAVLDAYRDLYRGMLASGGAGAPSRRLGTS
jgi:glycosyltransferase involved in cell wall biosynthesis